MKMKTGLQRHNERNYPLLPHGGRSPGSTSHSKKEAADMADQEKKLEEKNEKELLQELIRLQQKSAKRMRIIAAALICLAAALIVTVSILVPRVTYTLSQADLLIQQTDLLIGETEELVNGTNDLITGANDSLAGIDKMVDNVNGLVEENMETVTQSITKINEIDFEKLNQSIGELSDVLEPLANFANMFKK